MGKTGKNERRILNYKGNQISAAIDCIIRRQENILQYQNKGKMNNKHDK